MKDLLICSLINLQAHLKQHFDKETRHQHGLMDCWMAFRSKCSLLLF
jgi:hypothetical protein